MKATDALMLVAVVAVALASINLIITINKIGDFKALTGFMADTGTANLTIQSNIQIKFNLSNINWGSGYVSTGNETAELNTLGVMNGTGWNTISQGLILENIGSTDAQVNLTASKNAADFIGGSVGGGPVFQWNITDLNYDNSSEPNGCNFLVRNITTWTSVATTATPACDNFTFRPDEDEMRIDLRVVIPNDANQEDKGVIITATADVVS